MFCNGEQGSLGGQRHITQPLQCLSDQWVLDWVLMVSNVVYEGYGREIVSNCSIL